MRDDDFDGGDDGEVEVSRQRQMRFGYCYSYFDLDCTHLIRDHYCFLLYLQDNGIAQCLHHLMMVEDSRKLNFERSVTEVDA